MKKAFLYCSLFLLFSCTQDEKSNEQTASDTIQSSPVASASIQPLTFTHLSGIWINTDYQQKLEQTKSPLQAATEVPNLSFYREAGQPVAFVNVGFREGITVAMDSLQQSENGLKNKELTIQLDASGQLLSLQMPGNSLLNGPATFRRISRAELSSLDEEHDAILRYINQVVLVGTYQDEQGKSYQFTPEMKAILPDATFAYDLATHATFAGCDGIYAVESGAAQQSLGFVWKEDRLHLYHTKPDPGNPDGKICEKKPFAVLSRTVQQ